MVKNEADVINVWLENAAELFDWLYIADHSSSDGTRTALSAFSQPSTQVRLFDYNEASYDQDQVLEALRHQCVRETDAEWLFVLDADEFLPYRTRSELHDVLSEISSYDVLDFRWRNCFSRNPGPLPSSFAGFARTATSSFGKVAFRRNIAEDRKYSIPKGAHRLQHETYGGINGHIFSTILHFPIRSEEQLIRKLLQGCHAYLKTPIRATKEGSHWFSLLNHLIRDGSSWYSAPFLVADYGDRVIAADGDASVLIATKFSPENFRLSNKPTEFHVNDRRLRPITLIELVKRDPEILNLLEEVRSLDRSIRENTESLMLEVKQSTLVKDSNWKGVKFDALPLDDPSPIGAPEVCEAAESAFWPIRDASPSAWGEHIPFMFALVTLLRPRRYAELGVHHGTSFFAACQAVDAADLNCECVAIDSWAGERHAGKFNKEVFEAFKSKLRDYSRFAGYIASDFNACTEQFAEGSIDLLHIDGFHTARAVKNDFDCWRSKLSDVGVILFHDTNEFKQDFGVWRFWRCVREQYHSISFGHCHGLGVLIVGKKCPLLRLLNADILLSSDEIEDILQIFFAGVGRTSWSAASSHRAAQQDLPRQSDVKPVAKAVIAPKPVVEVKHVKAAVSEKPSIEVNATKSAAEAQLHAATLAHIANLEAENRYLRESTSWRVTRPLRALKSFFGQ